MDLDGPILDVSERYYFVYRTVMEGYGARWLGKDEYWELKRRKVPLEEILRKTSAGLAVTAFRERRLQLIEEKEALENDIVFPDAYGALRCLRERHRVVLVTLRHSREQLDWELERLRLASCFAVVLCSGAHDGIWTDKVKLIECDDGPRAHDSAVIGDTEVDILAAKHLRLRSIAVTRGIRCGSFLEALHPDFLVEDLVGAQQIVMSGMVRPRVSSE